MKGLETGQDKVKKICDILRKDTLEPAKEEAEKIIDRAKAQAAQILESAKSEAGKIVREAAQSREAERSVFLSSLHQAGKQFLESLKNEIEEKLFAPALSEMLSDRYGSKEVVASLLKSVLTALDKGGIDADLDLYVPSSVSVDEINRELVGCIGKNRDSISLFQGSMKGGVEVKIKNQHLSIDLTDRALKEWISGYVRKDFREILFGAESSP